MESRRLRVATGPVFRLGRRSGDNHSPRAETENPTIEIVSTASRLPEAAAKVLAEARIEDLQTKEDRAEREPPAPFPVVDLHRSIKLTALTLRKSRPALDGAVRACDEGMHGVVISAELA
jgi:hypothetical protein